MSILALRVCVIVQTPLWLKPLDTLCCIEGSTHSECQCAWGQTTTGLRPDPTDPQPARPCGGRTGHRTRAEPAPVLLKRRVCPREGREKAPPTAAGAHPADKCAEVAPQWPTLRTAAA